MIFILLPAYNEEKNIKAVLDEINTVLESLKKPGYIVVINDGSSDSTGDILKKYSSAVSLEVISFEKNRGVGAGFRTGISRICQISKTDNDILISMDCDRTHPACVFKDLLGALDARTDIAIASRYHHLSRTVKLPFLRAFLSDRINFLLKTFFPIKGANDYTTFYRAYKIECLKKGMALFGDNFIRQKGFSSAAEILIKLRFLNPGVSEVALNLRFDLRTGKSKMKIFNTIYGYLSLIAGAGFSYRCQRNQGTCRGRPPCRPVSRSGTKSNNKSK